MDRTIYHHYDCTFDMEERKWRLDGILEEEKLCIIILLTTTAAWKEQDRKERLTGCGRGFKSHIIHFYHSGKLWYQSEFDLYFYRFLK